jgi:hypothetical protein
MVTLPAHLDMNTLRRLASRRGSISSWTSCRVHKESLEPCIAMILAAVTENSEILQNEAIELEAFLMEKGGSHLNSVTARRWS